MAQTLIKVYLHVVFSTKGRGDMILPEIERELFAYIGAILRNYQSVLIVANGTTNHIHLLVSITKNHSISDLLREIKKSSSYWIKSKGSKYTDFQWQSGYGAFSVGQSQINTVKSYIENQKKHHASVSFEEEYRSILEKYEIDYNENYFLD